MTGPVVAGTKLQISSLKQPSANGIEPDQHQRDGEHNHYNEDTSTKARTDLIGLLEEGGAEAFHAKVVTEIFPPSLAIFDSRLAGCYKVTQPSLIPNEMIFMLRPIATIF